MTRLLSSLWAILVLLLVTPVGARDVDVSTHINIIEKKFSVSYLHGARDTVEKLVAFYCQDQFGQKAELGPGACTKMLPIEANRCTARGACR